ncbi:Inner membrane protein YqaA [Marinomonas aquimarina]|uniref:Inner membrane protein YqaA n=1 Tax=Marinomonas aquimarina TaxID=295068 RepID=A0A1A8T698_9GAMM|nr:VTT domain-containing protein [Marinomonas aquimarina]SBS26588.1 Inner membrane protein YqaA [Marinomonas aquimarina]
MAATLLPLGSELLLLGFVARYPELALIGWGSASLGNTLGGMTNWWLGKYLLHFQERRWFPVSAKRLQQVQYWIQRFGQPALLFSWLPVVGDALCLAAGVAKLHWLPVMLWIFVGKCVRYGVLVWGTNALVLS